MRILYICNDMSVSGSPRAITTEALWLVRRSHQVAIASRGGPLVSELQGQAFHYRVELPIFGGSTRLTGSSSFAYLRNRVGALVRLVYRNRFARSLKLLRNFIGTLDPDLIVAHQPGPQTVAGLVAMSLGKPYVLRIQGVLANEFPPLWWHHIVRKAATVIAITPEIRDMLVSVWGLPPERITVIPTPVDLEPYLLVDEPNVFVPRVLFYGSLGPEKGQLVRAAIKAIYRVAQVVRDCSLTIVGDGTMKNELAREAEQVNTLLQRKVVTFYPPTRNVLPFLSNSSIVLGSGRAAMEALASGRILLCGTSSAWAGVFEPSNADCVASYNFSGRNTAISPDPEVIAGELIGILRSPERIRELGRFGRKFIQERYGLDQIMHETEHLYERLLENHNFG